MNVRWGMLAIGLVMLAAACAGTDTPSGATVPSPTSTTTDPASDLWAVPDPITETYVQRVLDELALIEGEALRDIVRERALTVRSIDLLGEIYTADALARQIELIQDAIDNELDGVRDNPGDPSFELVRLISGNRHCIFASLLTDLSDVLEQPGEPPLEYLTLLREEDDGRAEENPSGWRIDDLVFYPDEGPGDEPVEDRCAEL